MQDIDTATSAMAAAAGVKGGATALPTAAGVVVGGAIASARNSLGLSKVLGCSRETYYQGADLDTLYFTQVVPQALFQPAHNASQWFLQSDGGLRYDLYQGNVTVDDIYKILPFKDVFMVIRRQTGTVLRKLLASLNQQGFVSTDPTPASEQLFDAFFVHFDASAVANALADITGKPAVVLEPVPAGAGMPGCNTDMMVQWAASQLGPGPCTSPNMTQ